MAELRIVVGNGAEMRLITGESVDLIVEGPVVAIAGPLPGPRSCGWRCHHSIAIFEEGDPATVLEWAENNEGLFQTTVPAGWITRFHNAVIVRAVGESGTELLFTLPGDESATLTLE